MQGEHDLFAGYMISVVKMGPIQGPIFTIEMCKTRKLGIGLGLCAVRCRNLIIQGVFI